MPDNMDRRDVLKLLGAGATAGITGCVGRGSSPDRTPANNNSGADTGGTENQPGTNTGTQTPSSNARFSNGPSEVYPNFPKIEYWTGNTIEVIESGDDIGNTPTSPLEKHTGISPEQADEVIYAPGIDDVNQEVLNGIPVGDIVSELERNGFEESEIFEIDNREYQLYEKGRTVFGAGDEFGYFGMSDVVRGESINTVPAQIKDTEIELEAEKQQEPFERLLEEIGFYSLDDYGTDNLVYLMASPRFALDIPYAAEGRQFTSSGGLDEGEYRAIQAKYNGGFEEEDVTGDFFNTVIS